MNKIWFVTGIDVLINNAGYGFLGAFEEMSADEFKGQIDSNFWGS
jgi:NAD(P)-dependent dehydrogenase (short-subunit alcohol dehydrogenase family)